MNIMAIAAIEADEGPPSRPPAPRSATDTPGTTPRKDLAGLTCATIEAIVYATLGWRPPAGSAQECAVAAAIVGYTPGLASQINRPE
jgi:hypothetical protein